MHAYVTLLSTGSYLPGVACLAESLRRTGTQVPLVVAVSAGMPAPLQREVAAIAGVSRVLELPAADLLPGRPQQGHHWDRTFDKLHLFGLCEFSKIVYLDSDMVVLHDLDGLFHAPHMAAVAAGRLVHPGWTRLNSGLMVIEPQPDLPLRIAQTFAAAASEVVRTGGQALGDQDLINSYYPDWPVAGAQLDQGFNVFFEHLDAYLATGRYELPGQPPDGVGRQRQPVRVVHFIGRDKPWMPRGRMRHLLALLRGRLGPAQREVLRTYVRLLRAVH
ncbi:MAG: glycosyltransferase [Ramlibacter sp.]